jgi:hypothetical protein
MPEESLVVHPRQQQAALDLLQRAEEPSPAPRSFFPDTTGDILREHGGPSLGKTPHPCGNLEPVILTGLRTP